MKSVLLIGAAAVCVTMASVPSRAAELLTNGSFEDVKDCNTVGWKVPEHYAFAEGVGMNGTRALVFENRDDKDFYKYPSAQIAFEKGKRYEYSIWAKTEGLTGRAQLCMEWYDANGKWLSGSYQGGFGGTQDWTQLKGVTPPMFTLESRFRVIDASPVFSNTEEKTTACKPALHLALCVTLRSAPSDSTVSTVSPFCCWDTNLSA